MVYRYLTSVVASYMGTHNQCIQQMHVTRATRDRGDASAIKKFESRPEITSEAVPSHKYHSYPYAHFSSHDNCNWTC